MSILLAGALKELALQPGESRCIPVDDYEVVICRPLVVDDPGPMVDIYLNAPPSPRAIAFVVAERTSILPKPILITEDDLAPGELGSEDGWFSH